jgi:hypothetical protein
MQINKKIIVGLIILAIIIIGLIITGRFSLKPNFFTMFSVCAQDGSFVYNERDSMGAIVLRPRVCCNSGSIIIEKGAYLDNGRIKGICAAAFLK